MDKGNIIGGVFGELGETVKKGGKTAVEQVTGTGKFAPEPKVPTESEIKALKAKDEAETKIKLVSVRSGLDIMRAQQPSPELRPRERVEQQKRQELQAQEEKAARKPPSLQVISKKGTKERLLGVSG